MGIDLYFIILQKRLSYSLKTKITVNFFKFIKKFINIFNFILIKYILKPVLYFLRRFIFKNFIFYWTIGLVFRIIHKVVAILVVHFFSYIFLILYSYYYFLIYCLIIYPFFYIIFWFFYSSVFIPIILFYYLCFCAIFYFVLFIYNILILILCIIFQMFFFWPIKIVYTILKWIIVKTTKFIIKTIKFIIKTILKIIYNFFKIYIYFFAIFIPYKLLYFFIYLPLRILLRILYIDTMIVSLTLFLINEISSLIFYIISFPWHLYRALYGIIKNIILVNYLAIRLVNGTYKEFIKITFLHIIYLIYYFVFRFYDDHVHREFFEIQIFVVEQDMYSIENMQGSPYSLPQFSEDFGRLTDIFDEAELDEWLDLIFEEDDDFALDSDMDKDDGVEDNEFDHVGDIGDGLLLISIWEILFDILLGYLNEYVYHWESHIDYAWFKQGMKLRSYCA